MLAGVIGVIVLVASYRVAALENTPATMIGGAMGTGALGLGLIVLIIQLETIPLDGGMDWATILTQAAVGGGLGLLSGLAAGFARRRVGGHRTL